MSVVTNESDRDDGEDIREISRFLVQLEYNVAGYWSKVYTNFYPCTGKVGGFFDRILVTFPNLKPLNTLKNLFFKTQANRLL